jgi:hypothetical protein
MTRMNSAMALLAAVLLLSRDQEIRAQEWPMKDQVVYVSKVLRRELADTEAQPSAGPRPPVLPGTEGPPGTSPPAGSFPPPQDGATLQGPIPSEVKPPLAPACRPLRVVIVAENHLRLQELRHKKRTYYLGADWKNWVYLARADCQKASQRIPQTQPRSAPGG